MKKIQKATAIVLSALMTFSMGGNVMLSASAAASASEVTVNEDTTPDLGWAVPGSIKITVNSLPKAGTANITSSWKNDDDVTLYTIKVNVKKKNGQIAALSDNTCSRGMFVTDSQGRNSTSLSIPILGEDEEQEFSDGWVNGAKQDDELLVTMQGVVKIGDSYYESNESEAVTVPLNDSSEGKTFPDASNEVTESIEKPASPKVTLVDIPYDSQNSLVSGEAAFTYSWADNSEMDMGELSVLVTSPNGNSGYYVQDTTICREGENVPQEFAWTVSDGRCIYNSKIAALAADEEQVFENGFVNGAKDGDTLTFTIFGMNGNTGAMSAESDPVSVTLNKSNIGKQFPEEETNDDTQWAVPQNLTISVDSLPYTNNQLKEGEAALTLSWDNNENVSEGELNVAVTTSDGQSAMLMANNTIASFMWSTSSDNRNSYTFSVPTVPKGTTRVIDNGMISAITEDDIVTVYMQGLVNVNGRWTVTDISNEAAFTVAQSSIGNTYPKEEEVTPLMPEDLTVTVTDIKKGSMVSEGYGTLEGTVLTLSSTFKKPEGITSFFAAVLRPNTLEKVASGTMPFIRANLGSEEPYWDEGTPLYKGPNGETITETADTITVTKKVVIFDSEETAPDYYQGKGFLNNETMLVGVAADNGKVMSELATVEIPVSDVIIGKKFPVNPDALTEINVQYKDHNGIVKSTQTITAESDKEISSGLFTVPSTPTLDGYDFGGWRLQGTVFTTESKLKNALNDLSIEAVNTKESQTLTVEEVYSQKPETYDVNVENGTLPNNKTSGTYQVSTLITVTADAPKDGQKFSHWLRDGAKVSSNMKYSFYMPSKNVTLEAVYVNDTEDVEEVGTAIIESVTPNAATGKVSFVSVCNVPKDCKMIKGGLIATSNADIGADVTAENAEYTKLSSKVTKNTKNLKYTWTKSKVTKDTVWYVRAYLVYEDKKGIQHTALSSAVKANISGTIS